jgi:hypothetical protein
MTSQRALAYGRVTRTLRELGPAKLLAGEQARIRETADALLFCSEATADAYGLVAFFDICELGDHLVESGRWRRERVDQLVDDVWSCGPRIGAPLAAAA